MLSLDMSSRWRTPRSRCLRSWPSSPPSHCCFLRIELELAMGAKGMLMVREVGLEVPVGPDLRARVTELEYLERSIGRTGLLALKPLHVTSSRDVWHRHLLQEARQEGER